MGWYVYKAIEGKLVSFPKPSAQDVKEGHETLWLQWKPGNKKRLNEKIIKEALQNLDKLNNKNAALDFYLKFGPLVGSYIPRFCKVYHEGVHATPLDSVLTAAGTLRIMRHLKMLRDRELEKRIQFLIDLWEHLPEKYTKHARPLQEILLIPERDSLTPRLLGDVPAWMRDYCLYAPIGEDGQIKWNKLYFKKVRFETEVIWQPGQGADIILQGLFGAIADYLLKKIKGPVLCACGCGLPAIPGRKYADPDHRKNVWWKNKGDLRRKASRIQKQQKGGKN